MTHNTRADYHDWQRPHPTTINQPTTTHCGVKVYFYLAVPSRFTEIHSDISFQQESRHYQSDTKHSGAIKCSGCGQPTNTSDETGQSATFLRLHSDRLCSQLWPRIYRRVQPKPMAGLTGTEAQSTIIIGNSSKQKLTIDQPRDALSNCISRLHATTTLCVGRGQSPAPCTPCHCGKKITCTKIHGQALSLSLLCQVKSSTCAWYEQPCSWLESTVLRQFAWYAD